jgi:hypothetical protein
MFRIQRAPDKPMFVESNPDSQQRENGDVVLCAVDPIRLNELVSMVPDHTVRIEPDLSRALQHCLQSHVSRLLVDLTALNATALSALAQLRLLRPEQEIVLIAGDDDDGETRLDQTLLEGVPVVSIAAKSVPAPRQVTVRTVSSPADPGTR